MSTVPEICSELRTLQRKRVIALKSRIMTSNRLVAVVAGTIGYATDLGEAERKKKFKEAAKLIDNVVMGVAEHELQDIIRVTMACVDQFDDLVVGFEKVMVKLARELPVADWVEQPEQRGFGLKSLAIIVGETGDLNNYSSVSKLWKRLGCSPLTFAGKTLMGATWRSGKEGKMPAEVWTEAGYSPRRRSISYLIGEGLMKQNDDGPYRQRYDEAKAKAETVHPEWVACKCHGTGKNSKGNTCAECLGKGKKLKRCHLHGMLLATKLLLKNLWAEWTHRPYTEEAAKLAGLATASL